MLEAADVTLGEIIANEHVGNKYVRAFSFFSSFISLLFDKYLYFLLIAWSFLFLTNHYPLLLSIIILPFLFFTLPLQSSLHSLLSIHLLTSSPHFSFGYFTSLIRSSPFFSSPSSPLFSYFIHSIPLLTHPLLSPLLTSTPLIRSSLFYPSPLHFFLHQTHLYPYPIP